MLFSGSHRPVLGPALGARSLAGALALVCSAGLLPGQSSRATDEQVRPVFLYQLAQYVNWPAEKAGVPLRFCILDDPDLVESLEAVTRGKSIQGRPVQVAPVRDLDHFQGCDVGFTATAKPKRLQEFFARWTYPPVLLAGELKGFAEAGGMVNLRIESGRVAFDVNIDILQRAGLSVRSQLLRLAKIVPTGKVSK